MTSKEEMQSLNEELTTVNTELQTKNEELTLTNNDMVNLLNSTQIATIFLDTHLNIRRFTPSVGGIINLRPSDIGRPVADIAANLTYDALVSDTRQVLDSLAAREAQVMTKDGLWFDMRMMPYRTLDNVIDGVVVTFSDITVPKRLEESLKWSEERFRRIFEQGTIGIAVIELDGRFVQANPAFQGMLGYSDDELRSLTVADITHPDDLDLDLGNLNEAIAGKIAGFEIEKRYIRKDGEAIWGRLNGSIMSDADGKPAFAIGMVEDITARKVAAEVLRKYQMLSENSRDIVLFVRQDGRIIEANEAAVSAYGYTREELLALTVFDLRTPEDLPAAAGQLAAADATGILFEAEHRRKDGTAFPVEVSSRGTDVGGQRVILSVIRDITQRKRAEQLSDALNRINLAMRSTLSFGGT